MIEVIGWMGTFFLSVCGLPQLYTTIKKKTVEGLSVIMCFVCSMGCLFALTYILKTSANPVLITNYSINSVIYLLLVILYFKYRK